MADVTDMVARAEADLRDAEAASVAADARAQAAHADAAEAAQQAKEMRAVLDWLRARTTEPRAPAERAGQAQKQQQMRFGRPVPENPLTEQSLGALENLGRSASTKQIRERLAREGHEFSQGQVRAAMRYLSKKADPPVTTTPGSGLWRLVSPRQAAPSQSATVAGLPAANGAGGRP
jgi:hypothetical protein